MAAYDTFDYPSYWVGREYEHESEIFAITTLLSKIKEIHNILEIGSGFGRLTPSYVYRAEKIILSDPSAKLLSLAKKRLNNKNILFIKSGIENLPKVLKSKSIDLIIVVRVLHHIKNYEASFDIINKLLKKKGYLILEFPNKLHLKAIISGLLRGNLISSLLDIFPKDIRSSKSIKDNTLPFFNYHPDTIRNILKNKGFSIIDERSVSNIRSPFLKKILPLESLLFFEKILQKPLSKLSFGPSIFILVKKTG